MKKIDISKIKHTFAGGGAILTNRKHVLITFLVFLELLLISFGYISYGNKNLDKYIIGKSTSDSSLFAIMLEDSTGEYKQSSTSTFPGYEYFYNQSKSGCMNNSGKQIKDSLLYDQDNKKATVNVSETSMCYLYFDKYKSTSFSDELIASNTLWQSNLEGDGYRFTGSGNATASTSPKNFICFGTTDKDTCTANPSTYMYRLIGVFADETGVNHVKLIKYTQLPTAYAWNADPGTDIDWADSDLFKGLNGSYFLTNTNYSYMQDSTWLNKITDWKWSAVNTLTKESSGLSYYSATAQNIYLHEMNRTGKTSTIGEWTTPTAKIGLMYVSDYMLSLGASALSYTGSSNKATLKTGWMHQSNNDTTASTEEWTISRAGGLNSYWYAWHVNAVGYAGDGFADGEIGSRAVFYLESYVSKSSGSGSLSDPYIIGTPSGNLSVSLSNSGSSLTATITKGTGNLNKYCINTSSSITNCTWNNITNTSITYTMPSGGTYYVHVIDDAGYIAHSSLTYVTWNSNLTLAENLITYRDLWQSGLEGDGYRFTGTGVTCSYENGNYVIAADNQSTTPTCPTLYNYTMTQISSGNTYNYTYKTSCPSNTSTYTYSCTKLTATADSSSIPKNFICFGTTDKDTCTANPSTYMYRIIGVFSDENGDSHVKLIKYTQLGRYAWHSDRNVDVDWADSDLYKGLNGSYFLTNTTYSYMQDNTWLSKITDWKWTAVNTKTWDGSSGLGYYSATAQNIYLHEMNRTGKTSTIGEWTTPTAKIGLMYVSDYMLSLGQAALSYTSSSNYSTLKTGWMHPSNNDTTASSYEWTISRVGACASDFDAWFVPSPGVFGDYVTNSDGASPVLYLESDISGSGEGSLENPIILSK